MQCSGELGEPARDIQTSYCDRLAYFGGLPMVNPRVRNGAASDSFGVPLPMFIRQPRFRNCQLLPAMRFLNFAPLVILASMLCAIPYGSNAQIAERGALGTRVAPLRPHAALIMRRASTCPKNRHNCSGGCCLHGETCCGGGML